MNKVQNFVDDELKSTPGCTVKFSGLSVLGSLFAGHLESRHHCRCTIDVWHCFKVQIDQQDCI